MKRIITATMTLLFTITWMSAQIVTSTPTPLLQDSKDVVIYYHADQGNKGLMGQPASDPIYAHTGVITDKSTNDGDWKHAPAWGDNNAKYKLEYVSENLWKLNIGSINEYYGLQPGEVVKKLAFVFRNATCKKEGKTAGGGDIYLDVYQEGLQISLQTNVQGNVLNQPTTVNINVNTSTAAEITLTVNDTELAKVSNATSLSKTYDIKDYGSYTFKAVARAEDEIAEAETTFSYLAPSDQKDYPGGVPRMGAISNGDGTVTFCLAAPEKKQCVLVGSWDDYKILNKNIMHYQNYEGFNYFWITVDGLDETAYNMYYYLVDGSYSVGDPYARLILDGKYDHYISDKVFPDMPQYPSDKVDNIPLAVFKADINDYDWKHDDFVRPDKDNLMIYELLIRDFTGTEGKALGDGTVRGVIDKLDYLKGLHINTLELLPIMEFNGNASWGYNTNFYFAPDKAYGTPDDYKELIDKCHEAGIAVVLDIVFNQTDWLHPWFQMYPVGSNPFYNASAPHAYSVLNDWNQGFPLVQQQFKDAVRYWLEEYHVDGFRFDLVKGLGDNDSYANAGDAATNAYNASRVARMKELHDAMRQVNPDAYCINENLATAKEENEMAEDGELNWANVNGQGCQYAMGYQSNSGLAKFYAPFDDNRIWGSTISYLESHDEQRLAYQQNTYGAPGVKGNLDNSMKRLGSCAAQMLLCPGSHMVWQFQEFGNDQTTKKSDGNDTGNKIVKWGYNTVPQRWGLHDNYAELMALRNDNPELFAKDAKFSFAINAGNWANGRTIFNSTDDKELITVINPNIEGTITVNVTFRQPDNAAYKIVSVSYDSNPTFDAVAGTVTVEPNCYVTLASQNVTGIDGVVDDSIIGSNAPAEIYTLNGVKMSNGRDNLPAGIYIVRQGSKASKILVK